MLWAFLRFAEVSMAEEGLAQAGLEEEGLEARVERIRSAFPRTEAVTERPAEAWVREVFDGYVVAEADGKLWKVAFSETDAEVTFAPRGEWVEDVKIIL